MMPTDQELIARLADRDEDAFGLFLDRHTAAVRRRVTGILREPASTEDVIQEAFLRLWTNRDRLRGGSVKSWLLTTVTNLALNRLRSRKRRTRHVDPRADPEGTPAPQTAGLCDIDGAERREAFMPEQVGRACPVQTPEGGDVGRLLSVARGAAIRDGCLEPGDASREGTLSLAAASIPFLAKTDPARVLMGANMMRQWLPPGIVEPATVRTGLEAGSPWLLVRAGSADGLPEPRRRHLRGRDRGE